MFFWNGEVDVDKAVDLALWGKNFSDCEDYENAIKFYDLALKINPNYKEAHCNKGVALATLGNYDDAIKCYEAALQIDPNCQIAHYCKGLALYKQGKHDAALKCYDKVLRIDPNDKETHHNIGIILAERRDYNAAIKSFNQALCIDPNDKETHMVKGMALADQENYDAAIKSFNAAIRIDQNFAVAYYGKGLALFNKMDYDGAIECYDKALKIDPYFELASSGKKRAERAVMMKQRNKKLLVSAKCNDINSVQKALSNNAVACEIDNSWAHHGWSALHWASYHGNSKMICLILEVSANQKFINQPTSLPFSRLYSLGLYVFNGLQTSLHLAAQGKHRQACSVLLEYSANTESRDYLGNTPRKFFPDLVNLSNSEEKEGEMPQTINEDNKDFYPSGCICTTM
jgi:tetratricopeptide (TPR) repeat protein